MANFDSNIFDFKSVDESFDYRIDFSQRTQSKLELITTNNKALQSQINEQRMKLHNLKGYLNQLKMDCQKIQKECDIKRCSIKLLRRINEDLDDELRVLKEKRTSILNTIAILTDDNVKNDKLLQSSNVKKVEKSCQSFVTCLYHDKVCYI